MEITYDDNMVASWLLCCVAKQNDHKIFRCYIPSLREDREGQEDPV